MKKVIFSIVVVLFVTLAVGLSVAQLPFEIPDDEAPAIEPGGGNSGSFGGCGKSHGKCEMNCPNNSCSAVFTGGNVLGPPFINSGSVCPKCGYQF